MLLLTNHLTYTRTLTDAQGPSQATYSVLAACEVLLLLITNQRCNLQSPSPLWLLEGLRPISVFGFMLLFETRTFLLLSDSGVLVILLEGARDRETAVPKSERGHRVGVFLDPQTPKRGVPAEAETLLGTSPWSSCLI